MSAPGYTWDQGYDKKVGYPATPSISDPTPWQAALTGQGQTTKPGLYTLPGDFNAWQNYNTPTDYQGWNYTTDPYFNAGADRAKWDLAQTGAGSEDDRARVWRWVFETLGADPGSAPQAAVNSAYLAAIDRLKRDYAANGYDWSTSPFAGYDQFLNGQGQTSPNGATQAVVGQSNGSGLIDQGGNGMADNEGGLTGGSYGPPQQNVAGGTYNTRTGTSGGQIGQFKTDDLASILAEIQSDPDKAAAIWRAARGQNGPALGRMANTRNNLYGQALMTYLGLAGLPGMGSAENMLQGFINTTNNPTGLLDLGGQLGQQLGGMNLSGFTSDQLDQLLSAVAAMRGTNMGRLARSNMGTQLENLQTQDWLRSAGSSNYDNQNYAGDLKSTPYGQALMAYLTAR